MSEQGPAANFCFLSKADNTTLGGTAPSVYRDRMPVDVDSVLTRALCPASLFDDDYQKFLVDRAKLLTAFANELIT